MNLEHKRVFMYDRDLEHGINCSNLLIFIEKFIPTSQRRVHPITEFLILPVIRLELGSLLNISLLVLELTNCSRHHFSDLRTLRTEILGRPLKDHIARSRVAGSADWI